MRQVSCEFVINLLLVPIGMLLCRWGRCTYVLRSFSSHASTRNCTSHSTLRKPCSRLGCHLSSFEPSIYAFWRRFVAAPLYSHRNEAFALLKEELHLFSFVYQILNCTPSTFLYALCSNCLLACLPFAVVGKRKKSGTC